MTALGTRTLHGLDTPFSPPKYLRVGTVQEYNIGLLRDRGDPDCRFGVVLSKDCTPRVKRARVLAEVDGGLVYLRGAEVRVDERGKGLGVLVMRVFEDLIQCSFGLKGRTRLIDKPVLALALSRAGYHPMDTSCPLYVKPLGNLVQVCHENRVVDLNSRFPRFFRKSQGIILVRRPEDDDPGAKQWKRTHVFTDFEAGDGAGGSGAIFDCAALIAFWSTVESASEIVS